MITFNDILKLAKNGNKAPDKKVEKTNEEWKKILTEEEYYVTREGGTEPSMSSGLCHIYEPGKYACVCCNTILFDSNSKFESKSGWPSFTEPVKDNVISYFEDNKYSMNRIEVRCSTCGAHLGHVFNDGPQESTGLRFCINGLSIKKV
jgi:methionine-R-sulfoxide reductase